MGLSIISETNELIFPLLETPYLYDKCIYRGFMFPCKICTMWVTFKHVNSILQKLEPVYILFYKLMYSQI